MTKPQRRRVTIFQHRLLHYRVPVFERMRELCARCGIELQLVHGRASEAEQARKDEGALAWASVADNYFVRVAGSDLLWQHCSRPAVPSDLFIIMQESRILSNYWLLLQAWLHGPRIAYWGHGANFQSRRPDGIRERWKRSFIGCVDWWFAYTQATVDILMRSGFEPGRITCLNNALDTATFQAEVRALPVEQRVRRRAELGLAPKGRVGLFCGSLYPEKRLDLLLAAADLIRSEQHDFHLVIVGDGPLMPRVRAATAGRAWIHPLGVQKGRDKALLFGIADVIMNPGLLGLHILDAFAAGLPLVSTRDALHSPEIAYLEPGVNGILTANDPRDYAEAVLYLLRSPSHYRRVASRAAASGQRYSVEAMVQRFVEGIGCCLESPPRFSGAEA